MTETTHRVNWFAPDRPVEGATVNVRPATSDDTPEPLPNWPLKRPVARGSAVTKQELRVLDLVSRGYSNNQIGQKLFISENSVKTALRSLYVRIDARDRAHAVRLGFELGLLTADSEATR